MVLVTGSAGLVGSEAAAHFGQLGMEVVGVDNDMRRAFFGDAASTAWTRSALERSLGDRYRHEHLDVRDREGIFALVSKYGRELELVIHAAAQPSHDWAARQPVTDFDINAVGTLNLLEAVRCFAPEAVFIFLSSNKVYGDHPNRLPLAEKESRWELDKSHPYWDGIPEEMALDGCMHSVFGASKAAADLLVQEYGRYFGVRTACFRGGTLTGARHSPAELHGFLSYIIRCIVEQVPYTVYGYKGKQVRDAIHSRDLVRAFECFYRAPRHAEVYNLGGGRFSNASVLEAIALSEEIAGRQLRWSYLDSPRPGDHIWWISDNSRFHTHYPEWQPRFDLRAILEEIYETNRARWTAGAKPPRVSTRSPVCP